MRAVAGIGIFAVARPGGVDVDGGIVVDDANGGIPGEALVVRAGDAEEEGIGDAVTTGVGGDHQVALTFAVVGAVDSVAAGKLWKLTRREGEVVEGLIAEGGDGVAVGELPVAGIERSDGPSGASEHRTSVGGLKGEVGEDGLDDAVIDGAADIPPKGLVEDCIAASDLACERGGRVGDRGNSIGEPSLHVAGGDGDVGCRGPASAGRGCRGGGRRICRPIKLGRYACADNVTVIVGYRGIIEATVNGARVRPIEGGRPIRRAGCGVLAGGC